MTRLIPSSAGRKDDRRDALIALMHRAYEDIRAIEAEARITVDDRDLRPRIEYFHDAVRALTEPPEAMYQPRTRLCIEWLTFDLNTLRFLQDKPLAKVNRSSVMGTSQQVATRAEQPLAHLPPHVKANLSAQYRTYTVFFAALFAEAVDKNFQARVSAKDGEVEDLAQIEQMIKLLEQGQGNVREEQVEELINHLDNETLRHKLMTILHQASMKKREKLAAAQLLLKNAMKGADAEIAALDKLHTAYLSGQMVLLQDSRDIVKRLSSQGLNLAGKFLETAFQQAGQGKGRGY